MKNSFPMRILKKETHFIKSHKLKRITRLYDSPCVKQDNPKQMHIIPNHTQNTKIESNRL